MFAGTGRTFPPSKSLHQLEPETRRPGNSAGRGLRASGPRGYRVPVRACRPRLAVATVIQSRAPRSRGRAPALRSAVTLVDRPIADSATETRKTDACSRGECAAAGMTPKE